MLTKKQQKLCPTRVTAQEEFKSSPKPIKAPIDVPALAAGAIKMYSPDSAELSVMRNYHHANQISISNDSDRKIKVILNPASAG